ncbi:MAG: bifunctional DNA-binding transcriptional regulator/O6-methylguanine-DNA methyltransferase Ada [Gammaproteobacteria bacterium]
MTAPNVILPNDLQWQKIIRREESDFIYAVKTTGIYCRPQCASKKPRRENAEYFARAEDAARAGYRACKKCRPEIRAETPPQNEWLAAACRALADAEGAPPLGELAAAAGMSARHFHRRFLSLAGITPKQYAMQARREKWRDNLRRAKRVSDAVYDSGFASGARAYENVYADLGMTPAACKNGAARERIQYALAPSALGRVLVAATARGVCAINFGDSDSALREEIKRQFPRAEIVPGDAKFCRLIQKTAKEITAPHAGLNLPLDIRGTVFQQKVWRALQKIPPGKTASYSQIAAQIGKPRAVRAVASACGKNPLAAAIPCHRAIGKNGELRGYRWGIERKRALLSAEMKTAKIPKNQ